MSLNVDFPITQHHTRKRSSLKTTQQSPPSTMRAKVVRFSAMSELVLFEPRDSDKQDQLHYSQKDYQAMKLDAKGAVKQVQREILQRPIDDPSSTEDLNLTGIEHLVTPRTTKRVIMARRQCWRAVFEEQARQDHSGDYSVDEIARVSRHYTKCSADRAFKIGMYQSKSSR